MFGHNRHGLKLRGAALPLSGLGRGAGSTSNTVWSGQIIYLHTTWHLRPIQPFDHNIHGPKIVGDVPFLGEAGPRPTSAPCGILIHTAVSPQYTWAKMGSCALHLGKLEHLLSIQPFIIIIIIIIIQFVKRQNVKRLPWR